MRSRTILINSMSKTFSVTGLRDGFHSGAMALGLGDDYYAHLPHDYGERKDKMVGILEHAGFRCFRPKGAYYVMTDISAFGFADDFTFARHLLEHVGLAGAPGSSFRTETTLAPSAVVDWYANARGARA